MVSKRMALCASFLMTAASVQAMQENTGNNGKNNKEETRQQATNTTTTTTSTALVARRSAARPAQQEQEELSSAQLRALFRAQGIHPSRQDAYFTHLINSGQPLTRSLITNTSLQPVAQQAHQINQEMYPTQEQPVTTSSLWNACGRYLRAKAAQVAALPGRVAESIVQSRPVQATVQAGTATVNSVTSAARTTANGVTAVANVVLHPVTTTQRLAGAIAQRIAQTRVAGSVVNTAVATAHGVTAVANVVLHPVTTTQRLAGAIAQRMAQTRVAGSVVNTAVATANGIVTVANAVRHPLTTAAAAYNHVRGSFQGLPVVEGPVIEYREENVQPEQVTQVQNRLHMSQEDRALISELLTEVSDSSDNELDNE